MTKQLKAMAIVVFILPMCTGTASALAPENSADENIPVIVNYDGVPQIITTDEKTVGELMASVEEFKKTEYEIENANEETILSSNMILNVKTIKEEFIIKTEPISYKTIYKETDKLNLGEEQTIQEGKEGIFETKIKQRISGGKIIYSEKVDEKIIENPIDKIIEKGTAIPKPKNIIDGYEYIDSINVRASGYTPLDPGCNGITATGTIARKGVIAVDPKIIPLGTKVYIPGYGVAIAEDKGGAIKGHKVDLCYETKSQAYSWGVRNITLYVLK